MMQPNKQYLFSFRIFKPFAVSLIFIACLFSCQKEPVFSTLKIEVDIDGNDNRFLNQLIQLKSDTVYRVASNLVIRSGQKLVVEAGTLIKVNNGFGITIEPGAELEAVGNEQSPIVFTSSAFTGSQGVNFSGSATTNWRGIELLGSANRTSGTLKYVRIEFAGYQGTRAGLYVENVDDNTVLEYIQVSYTYATPSFVFSEGSSNAKNLISFGASGSDFQFRGGYTGKVQNIVAYRIPAIPFINPGLTLAGIMINEAGTAPIISNATVIGPDLQRGTSFYYLDTANASSAFRRAGVVVFDKALFHIRNSVVLGFPVGGIYIDSRESAVGLANAQSELTNTFIHSNDVNRVFYLPRNLFPGIGPQQLKDLLMQAQFSNVVFDSSADFQLTGIDNSEAPSLLPKTGSPILGGANFDGPLFSHPFFNKVKYAGAFDVNDWIKGWTNFIPLQTNYNN